MAMDKMQPDVKAALREAKFYLNGAMITYAVAAVMGMLIARKMPPEEGATWVVCVGCLSVPLMFMFIIYYHAMRSVKDAEMAYNRQQICDALMDVEKNLYIFLIASMILTNLVAALLTALVYIRIKGLRKDLQSGSVEIPAADSMRTTRESAGATPRGTASEMDEDTPPPGVDYWEWKEKHGYWARKKRGEP